MDYFDPSDLPLPDFLDPILNYVQTLLPPAAYNILIAVLSHCLALFTALFNLTVSLVSSKPWEWDAQTVLPPLISFLAAYLALTSIYRTTSWAFRSGLFFIKWGCIIGTLVAGTGCIMGTGNDRGGGVQRGIVSGLTGVVLDMINGQGQNAAGGTRARTQAPPGTRRSRPRAWDSFDDHRDWQYREEQENEQPESELRKILGDIVGATGRAVRDGGWWEAAKTFAEGIGRVEEDHQDEAADAPPRRRKQPARKAKAKARARNTRSR